MNNYQPLVVIGVPAFNRPEGLRRVLNALCKQRYQHLEIYVSDDCSSDSRVNELLVEFSQKDRRIKFYRQEKNLGIIRNHQFLLSKMPSRAKYVMWACDDDHWHPDYIYTCVLELEKHPEVVLCSTGYRWSENGVFCDISYSEQIHTLDIDDPVLRYQKVLSNILWWNHSFYGVIRKSAYDQVSLCHVFAFDIHFILSLSLFSPFIQVGQPYFVKNLGGHGSNLRRNLSAVKVQSWLSSYFPKIHFLYFSINTIFQSTTLTFLSKLKLSVVAVYTVAATRMYGQSFFKKISELLHRSFAGLKLIRVLLKIGDFKLARLVSNYGLPLNDLHYLKKKKKLLCKETGLVFGEESSLFEAYNELIWLKKEYDAFFEYKEDQDINLIRMKNVMFSLREGYYSFLLREVFIKEIYNFDLSIPSIVIDIGTNVGVSALYFASNENVKRVFGFEPFQETTEAAMDNFRLNPSLGSKIQLEQYGLSNTEGTLLVDYSFQTSQLASSSGSKHPFASDSNHKPTEIKLKTASGALKDLLNEDSGDKKILKIDTEGSELLIIKDLIKSRLLSKFSLIMLEWHHEQESLLIEALKATNFEVYSVDKTFSTIYGDTGMIYALNKSDNSLNAEKVFTKQLKSIYS